MSDKRDDNRFLALLEERPRRSFYSHIRNAAILLKLHGLFPFENVRSDDGRSLSFKWLSLNVLWGFAVYTISSIVLYWLPFDEQIKNVFFYQYVVRVWLFYLCYTVNSERYLEVLSLLETINDKLGHMSTLSECNFTSSWRYCLSVEICSVTLYCSLLVIYVLSVIKGPPNAIFALPVLVSSLTSSVEIYVSMLYLLTASRINLYYRCLYDSLRKCLVNMRGRGISKQLEFLRISHADLSDACDKLYEWFGITFICIFSALVLQTLLIFYKITILASKISVMHDLSCLSHIFGYLYVLTTTSQKLANSNMEICSVVRNTSTIVLPSRLQFQLRLMILQTTALPVNTYALGFFITTRSLIPGILSVIAVYITVIIQLGTPMDILSEFEINSSSSNNTD